MQGTSIPKVVAPVNPGTLVATRAHANPLVDGGPRSGWPEQLAQPLSGLRVIAAPCRVDHHLRGKRDRLHLDALRLGDERLEAHRRSGREREVRGAGDLELGCGYRTRRRLNAHRVTARARIAAKNSGTAVSIAEPPEIPSQRDLISPTSP